MSSQQYVPWDAVELWTSATFDDEGNGKSDEKPEAQYYFDHEVFYTSNANSIHEHLRERLVVAEDKEAPLVVIASIQGNPTWLSPILHEIFPPLASGPMEAMLDVNRWHRGTVILPVADKNAQTMSFFTQYPMLQKSTNEIKFCSVATWVFPLSSAQPGLLDPQPLLPLVIFMACNDNDVAQRLQEHCVASNWQLQHLMRSPGRIFIDLFSILSEWSEVLVSFRRDLARRDAELNDDTKRPDILHQTRALHRDTANLIATREDLRLHITAFQRYQTLTRFLAAKLSSLWTTDIEEEEQLSTRTTELMQTLLHQQESFAVIHRQLENTLSLAFNTEMVSQGQAVGRLNVLAFIFLPLSYVATLFGMTNLSISARWYPVGAAIAIIAVALWFLVSRSIPNSSSKFLHRPKKQQQQQQLIQQPSPVPFDPEVGIGSKQSHSSASDPASRPNVTVSSPTAPAAQPQTPPVNPAITPALTPAATPASTPVPAQTTPAYTPTPISSPGPQYYSPMTAYGPQSPQPLPPSLLPPLPQQQPGVPGPTYAPYPISPTSLYPGAYPNPYAVEKPMDPAYLSSMIPQEMGLHAPSYPSPANLPPSELPQPRRKRLFGRGGNGENGKDKGKGKGKAPA